MPRLCREEGGVWLCAHPHLGTVRVCMQGQGPAPPLAASCPGAWLPWRRVLVLKPGSFCLMLLGVPWCSELAPDTHRTGTSSEAALCPCGGMKVVGRSGVAGRPVSALCPCALLRRKRGGWPSLCVVEKEVLFRKTSWTDAQVLCFQREDSK